MVECCACRNLFREGATLTCIAVSVLKNSRTVLNESACSCWKNVCFSWKKWENWTLLGGISQESRYTRVKMMPRWFLFSPTFRVPRDLLTIVFLSRMFFIICFNFKGHAGIINRRLNIAFACWRESKKRIHVRRSLPTTMIWPSLPLPTMLSFPVAVWTSDRNNHWNQASIVGSRDDGRLHDSCDRGDKRWTRTTA